MPHHLATLYLKKGKERAKRVEEKQLYREKRMTVPNRLADGIHPDKKGT